MVDFHALAANEPSTPVQGSQADEPPRACQKDLVAFTLNIALPPVQPSGHLQMMRFFAALGKKEMAGPPHVTVALCRPPDYIEALATSIEKALTPRWRQSPTNCCAPTTVSRCAYLMEGEPLSCQWSENRRAC